MKNNEANAFVFIASIIIGILISMNISFARENNRVFLSSKQYQDAYNYKNKLYSELSGLMEQYDKYYYKLQSYKKSELNQSQVTNGIEQELNENNIILGKVPVEGQGITIKLNDGDTENIDDPFEYQLRIVHNTDIIQILNDLRNASAEAISINGHRVTDRTEVYCSGPFLRVNGVKIAAPFEISAIGNKEVLYNYMMSNENYLKIMMTRKTKVNVEQADNVKIPAFAGEEKINFMKEK